MAVAVFVLASFAWAQDQEQIPDIPPLELPSWEHSVNLKARAGYKDNVTLANAAPEASAFVGTGLELVAWRQVGANAQFEFFVTADDRRYLSADSVEKEQIAYVLTQLKKDLSEDWHVSLGLEYLYQDQIVDVSVTEAELDTIRVVGHAIVVRPTVRRDLKSAWNVGNSWLELQLPAQRQLFRAPLDDYWEGGTRLVWGLPYGDQSELTFGYEFGYRRFDEEEQRAADGVRLPGTHRAFDLHEIRGTWRHYWDQRRRWRTSTKISTKWLRDNGGGYFDYTRGQVSEQVRFRTKALEIQAEVKLARYDYTHQTVAPPPDLTLRNRSEIGFNFRCERQIVRFLKIFAEYSYEQTMANRSIEEYTVNTVSGGLNWEF
jgi:hypothetical protein